MYIPKTMRQAIASNFYDKTVSILTDIVTIDAEGGVNHTGTAVSSTFKGNVSFSNCKEIQEEYGLDYNIDVAITTSTDTSINIDDIVSYDNVIYKVTDVLKSDSHILIVATKWRQ